MVKMLTHQEVNGFKDLLNLSYLKFLYWKLKIWWIFIKISRFYKYIGLIEDLEIFQEVENQLDERE